MTPIIRAAAAIALSLAAAMPVVAGDAGWGLRSGLTDGKDRTGADAAEGSLVRFGGSPLDALAVLEPADIRITPVPGRDNGNNQRVTPPRGDRGVVVVQRNLKELIETAGTQNRLEVKVSRGVRGIVRDAFLPEDLEAMLTELSRTYDLVWYRKGRTVNVSTAGENTSRVIFLGNVSFQRFVESMADAGLGGAAFPLEHLPEAQSVSITGPASFIAQAELISDALTKTVSSRSIMVIKGGAVSGNEAQKAGS